MGIPLSHGKKGEMLFLEQKGWEILEKAVFRKEGKRPQNQQPGSQVRKERRCGAKLGDTTDEREEHVILPKDRWFQLRAAHLLQTGTGQGASAQPPRG